MEVGIGCSWIYTSPTRISSPQDILVPPTLVICVEMIPIPYSAPVKRGYRGR